MLALIVAALIPAASLLQLAEALSIETIDTDSQQQAAISSASTALGVAAWHLNLVYGALFGTAFAASSPMQLPSAAAADPQLLAAAAAYSAVTEPLVSFYSTVVSDLRDNVPAIFFPMDASTKLLALTGYSSLGYTAASAVLSLQCVIVSYVWGDSSSTVYNANLNQAIALLSEYSNELATDGGYVAAVGLITEIIETVQSSWPAAARSVASYESQPANVYREISSSEISTNSVIEGLSAVASYADVARGALRSVARPSADTIGILSALRSDAVTAFSIAGYIGIIVVGFISAVLVSTSTMGWGAPWSLAAPLVSTVLLCLCIRAAESEALDVIAAWATYSSDGTRSQAWPTAFLAAEDTILCETALLIGAYLENISVPLMLSRDCLHASAMTANLSAAVVQMLTMYKAVPSPPDIANFITATDSAYNAANAAILSDCAANYINPTAFAVSRHRALIRRLPWTQEGSMTGGTLLTYLETESDSIYSAINDGICVGNVTSAVTAYINASTLEAIAASVATQPWFATVASTAQSVPFTGLLPLVATNASGDQFSSGVSVAWIMIAAIWCVTILTVGLHKTVYRYRLKRYNAAEFTPLR